MLKQSILAVDLGPGLSQLHLQILEHLGKLAHLLVFGLKQSIGLLTFPQSLLTLQSEGSNIRLQLLN